MRNLFEHLAARAAQAPRRPAIRRLGGLALDVGALCAAVGYVAARLPADARSIAVAGGGSVSHLVADLAVSLAGRRLVPLPHFFSPTQQAHILSDAAVDLVIDCNAGPAPAPAPAGGRVLLFDDAVLASLAPACRADAAAAARPPPDYPGGAERVIYTSGTTGAPKGVRHGDRQLDHALTAIAAAADARPDDRHLSLLPPSLLLEQIAGRFAPLMVGAEILLAPGAVQAALQGDVRPMAEALTDCAPTTTVLVPDQLAGLVDFAAATGWRPPASLRLVAVGGAPIAAARLAEARAIGLPVRFGYGLSEACSVVALADDEAEADGDPPTVGRPIDGLEATVEGEEIVVRGPGVMIGYLGRPPLSEPVWRTGDRGRIDADGRLRVLGRLDRTMTLASGRNVAPEWIESLALSAPWAARARADLDEAGRVRLSVVVRPGVAAQFERLSDQALGAAVGAALLDLPDYARPTSIHLDGLSAPRRLAPIFPRGGALGAPPGASAARAALRPAALAHF